MFQSIKCVGCEENQYTYHLVDTDFVCEVTIAAPRGVPAVVARAAAVTKEYSFRFLNVPKNLALCFSFYSKEIKHKTIQLIDFYKSDMDEYYPEIGFSKNYYNCLINQVKQLTYGKTYAAKQ